MSNLTAATARKLVASLDNPIDLKKYTKIKPDVAECLCGEADLDLSGLKEFAPALAAAFSKHQGKLILDGLKTLNQETALALKEHFKGTLQFGGMTEIADDVAQILSERESGEGSSKCWSRVILPKILKYQDTPGHIALFTRLALDSGAYDFDVSELTEKQASILAQRKKPLFCLSLKRINPEIAKALSKSDKKIFLPGINEVSLQTAEAFAEHTGELDLCNLDHVGDELAKEFAKHKGLIKVGGLKSMPDSVGYISLAKKLVADSPVSLSLPTEEIGDEVAGILSACERPVLTSLKRLQNTDGQKKLWEKMCLNAKETDYLSFSCLEKLPDAFAEIASRSKAKISFNGLAKWNETPGFVALASRIVASGSNSAGRVYLYGEFFPDKIAEIFAKAPFVELQNISIFDSSKGNLALAQRFSNESKHIKLKKITPEAAKILLAGTNNRVEAGDLNEINREVFECLYLNKKLIFLPIQSLPDDIAKLCEGEKDLVFPKLKTINLVLATSFGNGKGSLKLDGLIDIDDNCLKELVRREGQLSFQNLKSLSLEKAKIFSHYKKNRNGKTATGTRGSMYDLDLSGVEEICDEALNSLLELDSDVGINLNSVKKVSESNALKLSKKTGDFILNGLEEMPETKSHVALAKKLASSYWFIPKALKKIGPLIADALASKSNLELPALTGINVEVARSLAKTKELSLNMLSDIPLEVAKELSVLNGKLSLGNVDRISDEAFEELCKNKTKLSFEATELSTRKAKAIATVPSLYVLGLEEVSVDAAKCFESYKGDVYMGSLSKLSSEAAKELRKLKSKLSTTEKGKLALATGL